MAIILLVDDDKSHLNAMWRAFWLDGRHEAERFTNPAEALERAKEQAFDVAIADYRMPVMDGVRFLQAFRELQPQACRIMVSGNADMTLFRNAMNHARVHHLLEKPCDGFHLLNAVQEGLEQVALSRENARLHTELTALQQKYDQLSRRFSEAMTELES